MKLTSLDAIVFALAAAKVRYLVVGGLAVAAHGHGRVTFDIDVVVQLQPENVRRAMAAFESLGYRPAVPVPAEQFADAAVRESWIRDKGMVVFSLFSDDHPETRLDLFVNEPFDFDHEYDRALIGQIMPGLEARFVCLETLIRMKEVAGREKDLEVSASSACYRRIRTMKPDRDIDRRDAWTQHDLAQLRYFRSLSLRARLEAVQGMADVVRRFREMRKQGRFISQAPPRRPG